MILKEYIKKCDEVYHTTIDPKGPGAVRVHLIPPNDLKPGIPWVIILNGYYLLPVQTAWAVLLKIYIEKRNNSPLDYMADELLDEAVNEALLVFNKSKASYLKKDLKDMLICIRDVAKGKTPDLKIGFMTLAKYGKYMSAPHRLDLMVSSMSKNGLWACNQKCLHCYAADEVMSGKDELPKEEWFKIIDKAKEAHIAQLTFTGGEPTMREDIPELIEHASWFVTRLNTNGVLLTKELCKKLYDASLDSVQITFYSDKSAIHNLLVGAHNYDKTVEGIKNALKAGLDVSVNTPLCSINKNYLETIKYLNSLGVTYFSCSGLIPTGNARNVDSSITRLSEDEITDVLIEAYEWAKENECEISFTSPGWIYDKTLESMKMVVPSCGACLSNMAVSPDGKVIPCQSWLNGEEYGDMRYVPWKNIWNNSECRKHRKVSMKNEQKCPLKEVTE